MTEPEALLERDDELAALAAARDAAASGQGTVVLVAGPPGTGKTRLAQASAAAAAAAGLTVLRARGAELERPYGWGVVDQLFERWLLARPAGERARLLDGPAGPAAAVLGATQAAAEPFAAVHGLYWLAVHAAGAAPLALVVDDAHWADEASLRWLAYLADRLDDLALLVVVATRDGPGDRREPLLRIADRPGTLTVRPRPLSAAATADLLTARPGLDGRADLAGACHEATGGNPFLLHALIDDLAEVAAARTPDPATVRTLRPPAIGRSVLLRLGRLGGGAAAVARAVAILGGAATGARTATVAGLPHDVVTRAAAALTSAGLFADGLAFAHPLVAATVLDDIPAPERAGAHARAAAALRATGGRPEEIAAQLLDTEPGGDAETVAALVTAAEQALDRGAPHAAAAFLERAVREPPPVARRAAVSRLLGRALLRARGAAGLGPLREAVAAAPDPAGRADAALELARALEGLSRNVDAVAVYEQALGELPAEEAERAAALRGGLAVAAAQHLSTLPRALAVLAEGSGDGSEAAAGDGAAEAPRLALTALGLTAAGVPEGVELAASALAGEGLFAAETSIAVGLAIEALVWGDRLDAALAAWDEVIARARRRGGAARLAYATTYRAHVHLRAGRLADAEDDARAALTAPRETWTTAAVPVDTPAMLAQALLERGALAEAEALLAPAGPAAALSDYQGNNVLLLARGRLRLARARPADAAVDLLELGRRCEAWTLRNPAASPWRSHAALALRGTDPQRARALAAEEVELARAFGAPRALGLALRAAGLVGDDPEALEEAVAVLAPSPARLEYARAAVALGSVLRRAGRNAAAREPLATGLDLAAACGAEPLAEHAREELRAAGARPRRDRITGRDALTASERRVARLAAAGRTNREIAEELWITLKTVETHLGRSYRKLDVAGRAELAAALAARDAGGVA